MIGALTAPSLERRLRHPGMVLLICIVLAGTGYTGLIAAPVSGAYVWCALFGLRPGRAAGAGARLHRRPCPRQPPRRAAVDDGAERRLPDRLGGAVRDGRAARHLDQLDAADRDAAGLLVPMLLTGLVASRNRLVLAPESLRRLALGGPAGPAQPD